MCLQVQKEVDVNCVKEKMLKPQFHNYQNLMLPKYDV